MQRWPNKALHWIFVPLRSTKTSELGRYLDSTEHKREESETLVWTFHRQ